MTDQTQNGSPQNIILDGNIVSRLQSDLNGVFSVAEIFLPKTAPKGTVVFRGSLLLADSETAYDLVAERWQQRQYTPMLRRNKDLIELTAHPELIRPKSRDPRINLILFVITLASVLYVGASYEGVNVFQQPAGLLLGLPYAISLLTILLAHEFGHYFAARHHKVAVTLPYFIPLPFNFSLGTLGAFIQLRAPTKTRKELFDVGVAGPLAGLFVAIPVLIVGLMQSEVGPLPAETGYLLEGNSVFYWSLKYLLKGQPLPGNGLDVQLNSVAWAGWIGLFITMLNLLPAGQLDGGHVIYTLFGEHARKIGFAVVGVLVVLGSVSWTGWFLWAGIIFFLIGVGHPPPLNDLVPLDFKRRLVAYAVILIFVILFMPTPFTAVFPQ
jgi:membrane-associated protease RseP (regulator of RpoE activity)